MSDEGPHAEGIGLVREHEDVREAAGGPTRAQIVAALIHDTYGVAAAHPGDIDDLAARIVDALDDQRVAVINANVHQLIGLVSALPAVAQQTIGGMPPFLRNLLGVK